MAKEPLTKETRQIVEDLTERAHSRAVQGAREEGESQLIVTFSLGSDDKVLYGVRSELVRAIVKVGEITYIPSTPPHLLGVVNVRGEIESVLDLRQVLDIGQATAGPGSRLIIAEGEDMRSGLLVDSVVDILPVSADRITPPLTTLEATRREFVWGQIEDERGRTVVLLDLAKLFAAALGEAE